jgi:hypothetical protein
VTEWIGYQDNHPGLPWLLPFTKHYCKAASADSTMLTNDLRYRHIHIMMSSRSSSQIMAETQLNINKLVPFSQTNLRLDDDILDAILTLLARAELTFLL